MALKIEHGFHPPSFDEHGFEEDFDTHGFDFLGHHFAINTSANEELIHSIYESNLVLRREFRELAFISSCYSD